MPVTASDFESGVSTNSTTEANTDGQPDCSRLPAVTLKLPTHSLSQPGLTRSLTEYSTSVAVDYTSGPEDYTRRQITGVQATTGARPVV